MVGAIAGAAIQASTGIDDISLITLADSTSGADVCAGTAADASRSIDLVSHW